MRPQSSPGVAPHILLVGSYPPPYGGNSVHVSRLQRSLRDEFRIDVIDAYGANQLADDGSVLRCGARPFGIVRLLAALRKSRAPVVHFHVSGMDKFLWASYPLLASLRAPVRKMLTIHSGSFVSSFESGPAWRRAMLRNVLRRFYRIVAVNHEQRRFIERLGIDERRIAVVPAFLPPVARESVRARETLATLRPCERIVVSSGCGLPYYGFHIVLDAVARLEGPTRLGVLLCAYDSYDRRYMAELASRPDVRCTIVRNLDPGEFAWILQRCDVYVRATDRDGDAVAIREAMYFGKPVIASDCVERPSSSLLFRTGDSESLALALRSSADRLHGTVPDTADPSTLQVLLQMYNEALRT